MSTSIPGKIQVPHYKKTRRSNNALQRAASIRNWRQLQLKGIYLFLCHTLNMPKVADAIMDAGKDIIDKKWEEDKLEARKKMGLDVSF